MLHLFEVISCFCGSARTFFDKPTYIYTWHGSMGPSGSQLSSSQKSGLLAAEGGRSLFFAYTFHQNEATYATTDSFLINISHVFSFLLEIAINMRGLRRKIRVYSKGYVSAYIHCFFLKEGRKMSSMNVLTTKC